MLLHKLNYFCNEIIQNNKEHYKFFDIYQSFLLKRENQTKKKNQFAQIGDKDKAIAFTPLKYVSNYKYLLALRLEDVLHWPLHDMNQRKGKGVGRAEKTRCSLRTRLSPRTQHNRRCQGVHCQEEEGGEVEKKNSTAQTGICF